jgi:hypothetical protein
LMTDSDRLREDIEALPVERFAGLEHAMDGMQEQGRMGRTATARSFIIGTDAD